jgi:bifunctional oligoribonuclease and PAP phosphatase NrnA
MNALDIVAALKECKSAVIMAHVSPDGDSIGSMLALYNVLKRIGKDVGICSSDNIPSVFSFLPGYNSISKYSILERQSYDAAIVLDCGSGDRTGECSRLIDNADISINIDHHVTNSMFASFNLVDTNASATGELIFQLIKQMGLEIMKEEAVCLYTAILTDTGCFKYKNTTPLTHKIVGELISTGIEFGDIHDHVYRNLDFDTVKTMGKALCSVELYDNGQIALMKLLSEDLDGMSLQDIDTTDFINFARDIRTVEAAAFVKQVSSDEYKVSMRSKNKVDVRAVCEKYGGGGHVRAAGCTMNGTLESVKDTVLVELEQKLKEGIL